MKMTDRDWESFFNILRNSLLAIVRWIEKKYGW